MIEESYVSFDTAKMLKEAGFDVPCTSNYMTSKSSWNDLQRANFNASETTYSRPTQALAARWLREVHGIHVSSEIIVYPMYDRDSRKVTGTRITWGYYVAILNRRAPWRGTLEKYKSYEEALEAGLQLALGLLKTKEE